MRIVEVTKPYSGHGTSVEPGNRYLVEDTTLANLLNQGIVGRIDRWEPENGEGNSVLIHRAGGFGDLMAVTPLIRTLMAAGHGVSVCCMKKYADAVRCKGVGWEPYPIRVSDAATYGQHILLEGVIEFAEDPSVHIVDLIAQAAGVELTEGKHCSYHIMDESRVWAAENWPRRPQYKIRVGVQPTASVPTRTYPHDLMIKTLQLCITQGWEVAMFGNPGSIKKPENSHPAVLYVTESKDVTFDQSAAVLDSCDVVVAPDSAICHLAGALNKPTVALYGPFPWQARTKYHPSIRALTGILSCAPCYWHGRSSMFPKDGPCSRTNKCEALAQISPERIVREVVKLLP